MFQETILRIKDLGGLSTYISTGVVHSLENRTSESLEIIKVQSGAYLGEDDIINLKDIYGRITPSKI